MDGAKVNYFFNLLQAKTKKITTEDKDLTFAIVKALFPSDMYDSTFPDTHPKPPARRGRPASAICRW
jgi:hypothetical protein